MKKILFALMLILFSSFALGALPTISDIDTFPVSPNTGSNSITADWTYTDSDGDVSQSNYTWYLNGVVDETGNLSLVLDDFEDVSDWTLGFAGGKAEDGNDFKEGSYSGQINYSGTGQTDFMRKFPTDMNASLFNTVCIRHKANITDNNKVRLRFADNVGGFSSYFSLDVGTSWSTECIDISAIDRDNITQALIYMNWDDEDIPYTIWFDAYYWVASQTGQAKSITGYHYSELNLSITPINWQESGVENSSLITFNPLENIDILFSNISTGAPYLTNFSEGENIWVYLNYTDNNTNLPINDSYAECNITMEYGLTENESSTPPFSLCSNPSCDYTSRTEEFTVENNESTNTDILKVDACHITQAIGDIDVTISCIDGTFDHTINADQILACDEGSTSVFIEETGCINQTIIDVTLSASTLPLSRAKNITGWQMHREFFNHTITSLDGEVVFDSSLQLWKTDHHHEYYDHGTKNIYSDCVFSRDGTITQQSDTILISHIESEIFFNLMNNTIQIISLATWETSTILIEFATGTWEWFISLTGHELDTTYLNISNSSGDVIYQFSDSNLDSLDQILTNSSIFVPFANSYNMTVWLNDSFGESHIESFLFNLTDTTAPTATRLDNDQVMAERIYYWSATISDEFLENFSINCDNGYNFSTTGILTTTYNFSNQSQINTTTNCDYSAWDDYGNELSGTQIITALEDQLGVFDEQTCPLEQAIAYSFGYFMMWFILLAVFVINESVMKIPIFNFIVGLGMVFLSIPMFVCGQILGWVLIFLGISLGGLELYRMHMPDT